MWRGYAWAALAAVSFSFEGVLARGAFAHTAPFLAMAVRFALGAAIAFALPSAPDVGRRPRDRAILFATGFTGYAGTTALLFIAFGRIATSVAILLLYAYPAIVAAGAHLLGRERLGRGHVLGLVLTFAGVAIVGGGGGRLDLAGMLLALASAFTMAVTVLVQQPVLERVTSVAATRWTLLGATLCAVLLTLATGEARLPEAAAWPYLVGLAVVPTILAVLALNRGIQLVGAPRAAVVATLEPPFAALWGAVWLGERFGAAQALGALLVLWGVGVVQSLPPARLAGSAADPYSDGRE